MKKEFSLLNLIDFINEKVLFYIKKLGRLISSKKSHDTIYIFSKIIITLILLAIIKIPFDWLEDLGIILIYMIGNTFRHMLSICWVLVLNIAYLILNFVVLLKVFGSILKDKELNFIEDDRKKDLKMKSRVFNPIIKFIKVCLLILLIPLVLCVMAILMGLGMSLALTINGHLFISIFFILIGLLIMITSVILIVINITKGGSK